MIISRLQMSKQIIIDCLRIVAKNKKKFKIFKSAKLIKILFKLCMSILAAIPPKTRKITKKVPRFGFRDQRRQNFKVKGNYIKTIPINTPDIDNSFSRSQIESSLQSECEIRPINLNYFQSYNPYILGSINSIVFSNGRFYDLLYVKKDGPWLQKIVKCRCSKSQCSAKYCDCYSVGQACGISCQCVSCLNLVDRKVEIKPTSDRFCKCSKSGCQKRYCECLQRGDSCSSKCQCQNCKNTSGSISK